MHRRFEDIRFRVVRRMDEEWSPLVRDGAHRADDDEATPAQPPAPPGKR